MFQWKLWADLMMLHHSMALTLVLIDYVAERKTGAPAMISVLQ